MDDYTEPLLGGGLLATPARQHDGFSPAQQQALEAQEGLVNPNPNAGQQKHSGHN